MQSVKPGRGPSLMGGIGGIFAAIFGLIWIVAASSMGAPPFFALFGVGFIVMAIIGAVYNLRNATARNRTSIVDITSGDEEPDPIAQAFGYASGAEAAGHRDTADSGEDAAHATLGAAGSTDAPRRFPGEYCPFCGAKAGPDFHYCPKCGKDI